VNSQHPTRGYPNRPARRISLCQLFGRMQCCQGTFIADASSRRSPSAISPIHLACHPFEAADAGTDIGRTGLFVLVLAKGSKADFASARPHHISLATNHSPRHGTLLLVHGLEPGFGSTPTGTRFTYIYSSHGSQKVTQVWASKHARRSELVQAKVPG
jgi:hypothetical protein